MAETTNYGLYVTDDTTLPFKTWREKMDSETNSNIVKIDNILKGLSGNFISTDLSAEDWNDGVYSFETQYPASIYDIYLEVDGETISEEELTAWIEASIVSSATSNIYIALGETPTIDIPVVLRVVKR